MAITLYYFPPSAPARTALLAARAVGVDVTLKNVDLFERKHATPEFVKVIGIISFFSVCLSI